MTSGTWTTRWRRCSSTSSCTAGATRATAARIATTTRCASSWCTAASPACTTSSIVPTAPGHGGGADWNHQGFSPSTKLVYTGFGNVNAAHSLTESSNGLRPPGEYQTGGVVAVDPSTNEVKWKKHMPYELAHGNGIL